MSLEILDLIAIGISTKIVHDIADELYELLFKKSFRKFKKIFEEWTA